jgi:hypothetical protein
MAVGNLKDWEQHDSGSNPNKSVFDKIKELVKTPEGRLKVTKEEYDTDGLFVPYKKKIDNQRVANGMLPFGNGELIIDYLREPYNKLVSSPSNKLEKKQDETINLFEDMPNYNELNTEIKKLSLDKPNFEKDSADEKEYDRQNLMAKIDWFLTKGHIKNADDSKEDYKRIYESSFEEDNHFAYIDYGCFNRKHAEVHKTYDF